MAHLDYRLRAQGGLKPFLRRYATEKRHQSIKAREFQELVENFHGASLHHLFETYVYSNDPTVGEVDALETHENPHHLSIQELQSDLFWPVEDPTAGTPVARIHFDETLQAHVAINETGQIRSILHPVAQERIDGRTPKEAAFSYMCDLCSRLPIAEEQVAELSEVVSFSDPRERMENFSLLEERHAFDSHTFSFAQTYMNIPVWNSRGESYYQKCATSHRECSKHHLRSSTCKVAISPNDRIFQASVS